MHSTFEDELQRKPGQHTGFIKISLADRWDPKGYVRFEVDISNSVRIDKHGFEIIAIWQSLIDNEG